jgi:aryl-alcohol dehydrogenase-like predicted oxidoreductase
MMFGDWGTKDHDESIRIIHRALDGGINFIDTADVYSQGESEVIVGKALAGGRRDDVVLATKAHGAMGPDPNSRGVSRRWLIREVEDSLRRLGTDWIDLYQIHRYQPGVDIEETLGVLSATSAPRCSHRRRSSRRSGRHASGGCSATSASSRRTRCSPAPSRPTCFPHVRATAWP